MKRLAHHLVPLTTVATLGALPARANPFVERGSIDRVTLNSEQTSMTIVYHDQRQRIVRPDTAGDTFGMPALSPDRGVVGWTVERMDGASYAYPEWLEFIQHGAHRRFSCPYGMPWAWRFEGNDRAVVDCAFPHGTASRQRLLIDLASQRVLGELVVPDDGGPNRTAPAWARHAPPQP